MRETHRERERERERERAAQNLMNYARPGGRDRWKKGLPRYSFTLYAQHSQRTLFWLENMTRLTRISSFRQNFCCGYGCASATCSCCNSDRGSNGPSTDYGSGSDSCDPTMTAFDLRGGVAKSCCIKFPIYSSESHAHVAAWLSILSDLAKMLNVNFCPAYPCGLRQTSLRPRCPRTLPETLYSYRDVRRLAEPRQPSPLQ